MAEEDRLEAGLPMIAVAEGKWHQEMQGACGVQYPGINRPSDTQPISKAYTASGGI